VIHKSRQIAASHLDRIEQRERHCPRIVTASRDVLSMIEEVRHLRMTDAEVAALRSMSIHCQDETTLAIAAAAIDRLTKDLP
jgi:hypothetical protein